MRVLTNLPQRDLRLVSESARASEAAGYDGVATQENKHEPFMALAVAAVATEKLQLATSVAIAFPRSPMVTASTAWDLQLASRGRFVLGIGPQVRAHNEKRFSVPWTAPVPRLREYIKAMVSDHSEDDQAFLHEENGAKDPTLKNAVSQAEPIIADHLRMAKDLDKSLKGKGGSSSM